MDILISTSSGKPIYEQITAQLKAKILTGELSPGEPIPSMRAMARALHISVITVQKAYEDLARDGFIETTVGRGTFVAELRTDFYLEEKQRQAEDHLSAAVDIARSAGISCETLVETLRILFEEE